MDTKLQVSQGIFLFSSCISKNEVKPILIHDSLQYLMAKFKVVYLAPKKCSLSIILNTKGRKQNMWTERTNFRPEADSVLIHILFPTEEIFL